MVEIRKLFDETRRWRKFYRQDIHKHSIEASACAIRETALLDAMCALGLTEEERRKLAKI